MHGAQASVVGLWRYPFKGFAGAPIGSCMIREGKGIAHDRRWGVVNAEDRQDAEKEAYPSWELFRVLKNTAETAKIGFSIDDDGETLTLRHAADDEARWKLSDADLCAQVGAAISSRLKWSGIEVVDHAFSPVWDYAGALLSVVNAQSVANLSGLVGTNLDLRRFRANILVDGMEPWTEQSWIGKEISVGDGLRLRVVREIPRCKATCVNPDTGEEDVRVPQLLREHFGHANMGVLAIPVRSGHVAVGATVR